MIESVRKKTGHEDDHADVLLKVDNVHCNDCGPPPDIDLEDQYVSLFQNHYGEQWVFIGDREKKTAVIMGGDAGWKNQYEMSEDQLVPKDLVMNQEETLWLITCLSCLMNNGRVFGLLSLYSEEAFEKALLVTVDGGEILPKEEAIKRGHETCSLPGLPLPFPLTKGAKGRMKKAASKLKHAVNTKPTS